MLQKLLFPLFSRMYQKSQHISLLKRTRVVINLTLNVFNRSLSAYAKNRYSATYAVIWRL